MSLIPIISQSKIQNHNNNVINPNMSQSKLQKIAKLLEQQKRTKIVNMEVFLDPTACACLTCAFGIDPRFDI